MRSEFTHYNKPREISDSWHSIVCGLIDLRNAKGWSQEELAHRVGCAASLVHKWEQYKRVPSNFLFICWLDALEAQIEIKSK
jgi:ribosome-binding protein aMBF1 (putative translation factor)